MRALRLLLLAFTAVPAAADVVVLQNGRRIEVEKAWYEGAEVKYRRDGGTYGVPRALVRGIEESGAAGNATPVIPPSVVPSSSPGPRRTPFRLRYEGGLDEALGMAVLV